MRKPFVRGYEKGFVPTFENVLLSFEIINNTENTCFIIALFMPSILNVWVSKDSPAKFCIDRRSCCVCVVAASFFSYSLYMEMKRSFMLFPLVALFIAVCGFISWFHLRFCRLFLGKPLKCVSDSKQSSSRFPALLASSLMKTKEEEKEEGKKSNNLRFQSETTQNLKLKSTQRCA